MNTDLAMVHLKEVYCIFKNIVFLGLQILWSELKKLWMH